MYSLNSLTKFVPPSLPALLLPKTMSIDCLISMPLSTECSAYSPLCQEICAASPLPRTALSVGFTSPAIRSLAMIYGRQGAPQLTFSNPLSSCPNAILRNPLRNSKMINGRVTSRFRWGHGVVSAGTRHPRRYGWSPRSECFEFRAVSPLGWGSAWLEAFYRLLWEFDLELQEESRDWIKGLRAYGVFEKPPLMVKLTSVRE